MAKADREIAVLVAESDPSTRAELHDLLERDGRFGVVSDAVDGDGAVARAVEVDLVVVDLSVAGLGALGAIEHIRRGGMTPVVVGLSRSGNAWLSRAARSEGAEDVVEWPDDQSQLCDRLARAVDP